ncbi:hypothetical protein QFZ82_003265 [Streptomyces sp. V4I23]|nr:hypothetical protein [Streptomyces sp. V4I23]
MNLAFVESPVQLLNVLEWAHAGSGAAPTGDPAADLTVVVLSPVDPMSRGQLRRMAELARGEGFTVRWQEARGGAGAPLRTIRELGPILRRAERIVIGDPFSRYVQLLLTLVGGKNLTVVDDGTATMEFVAQVARGEQLVRWHRRGGRRGPRELVLAPVTFMARRRLSPSRSRNVEVFTSMPVEQAPGITVTANDFAWTRQRFGPPTLTRGADMVGTSLVETGVVDLEQYLDAVATLARAHGATRYFAHRRESAEKAAPARRRDGPGSGPPRPAAGADRPQGPDRLNGAEFSFDGRAHPPAGPRGHGDQGGGLRHRAGVAPSERVAACPGVPGCRHGHGPGRVPAAGTRLKGGDRRAAPEPT